MKYSFISLIFLLFLSIKGSTLDNVYDMDEAHEVTGNLIFIRTSDFQKGKEILIEVKAESFIDEKIYYEFVDDTDDTSVIAINTHYDSPYNTKNDNTYKTNYYKITKDLGEGVQGKFLALYFECTGKVTVGSTSMPSTQAKDILKKNGEISLKSTEGGFIFDSNSFNVGDKMYFNIKAKKFIETSIFYEFCDDLTKYYPKYLYEDYYEASLTNSKKNNSFIINYYTIEKDSKTLEGKTGKYLIAYFNCEGTVTVKNTPTDEGKSSKTLAIVLIIIIVVIVVGVFAFYCYRKKKNEGGFYSGNKGGEVEVYNNGQIVNNQNPNIANVNYQQVNVQNNKKKTKKILIKNK